MKRPGPTDRLLLSVSLACWLGAFGVLNGRPTLVALGGVLTLGLAARRPVWLAMAGGVVLGGVAGALSLSSFNAVLDASPDPGPVTGEFRMLGDPIEGRFGWGARARAPDEAPLLLTGNAPTTATAGDVVLVTGTVRSGSGTFRGDPYAGKLAINRITVIARSRWFLPANLVRTRVQDAVGGWTTPEAALVAGFLIGDISELPALHREQLTASGLSHFVAVSGSNVALFLALWWVVTAPLSLSARTRAITGVFGVTLFVMVTRWEPSVLRAGAMVVVLLLGRAVGIPLTGWGSLAVAVCGLVVVDARIVHEVGFQLSVVATGGLLFGSGMLAGRGPAWLTAPLGATIAAQAAVAPLLLLHFGTVPILAPLANLVAAPIVSLSTSVGGVGALLGVEWLVRIAVGLAGIVIAVASVASSVPGVGWPGLGLMVAIGLGLGHRRSRLLALCGLAVSIVIALLPTVGDPPASVSVLDVGQGDSILLRGNDGETVLIDGGPDPTVLARKLSRLGIRRLDLVVVSHRHADHVAGLAGVLGVLEVGEVWWAPHDELGSMEEVLALAARHAIPVREPTAGQQYRIGSIGIEVLGPTRRYASPNDASLVLVATINGRTVGLVGDVETFAQADLGPLRVDVLKVPHQGAATSSRQWLAASAGLVSVVSVGPNDYGHPAPWVIETLEAAGSVVCRTDRDGDVVIALDQASEALSGC